MASSSTPTVTTRMRRVRLAANDSAEAAAGDSLPYAGRSGCSGPALLIFTDSSPANRLFRIGTGSAAGAALGTGAGGAGGAGDEGAAAAAAAAASAMYSSGDGRIVVFSP